MRDAPPARGPRLRDLGLTIGAFPASEHDAITDVPGVTVGHVTVWRDEPDPPAGRGVARTGVTVIAPRPQRDLIAGPVAAGTAVLNGAGELTGSLQVAEWGLLETPIYLTSTMQVGRIYDGAVDVAVAADPTVGVDDVVIPMVGECDDSWLNEARAAQVLASDAGRAIELAAGGAVEEGCVGAGAGMTALGWKAGIGTAGRRLDTAGATVGVLVLANFGSARDLRIDGVAAGETLGSGVDGPPTAAGSCIAVVATDAPLSAAQLTRVARRCGLGLARTGSVAHHGSGEIFVAFSTADAGVATPGRHDHLDDVFAAAVEATEEAVLNALWAAVDTTGRAGRVARALPHADVLELLRRHERLRET